MHDRRALGFVVGTLCLSLAAATLPNLETLRKGNAIGESEVFIIEHTITLFVHTFTCQYDVSKYYVEVPRIILVLNNEVFDESGEQQGKFKWTLNKVKEGRNVVDLVLLDGAKPAEIGDVIAFGTTSFDYQQPPPDDNTEPKEFLEKHDLTNPRAVKRYIQNVARGLGCELDAEGEVVADSCEPPEAPKIDIDMPLQGERLEKSREEQMIVSALLDYDMRFGYARLIFNEQNVVVREQANAIFVKIALAQLPTITGYHSLDVVLYDWLGEIIGHNRRVFFIQDVNRLYEYPRHFYIHPKALLLSHRPDMAPFTPDPPGGSRHPKDKQWPVRCPIAPAPGFSLQDAKKRPFILLYLHGWDQWGRLAWDSDGVRDDPDNPCLIVYSLGCLEAADAIMWNCGGKQTGFTKYQDQVWVNWCTESYDYEGLWNKNPWFLSQFDVMANYLLDSDLPLTLSPPNISWFQGPGLVPALPKSGEAVALYLTRSCGYHQRDDYIKALMNYISVDSCGHCLNNKFCDQQNLEPLLGSTGMRIIANYKFFLAFENTYSKDWVTERFYMPLMVNSVPVYMGAPNIDDFAPGNRSYIDVREFSGPLELANYLEYLAENDTAYMEYFEWRKYPLRQKFVDISLMAEKSPRKSYTFAQGGVMDLNARRLCTAAMEAQGRLKEKVEAAGGVPREEEEWVEEEGDWVQEDINYCATTNAGCSTSSHCEMVNGTAKCTCHEGLEGNPVAICQDINECLSTNGGCHLNAVCTNSFASFSCVCAPGYNGTGVQCHRGNVSIDWYLTFTNSRDMPGYVLLQLPFRVGEGQLLPNERLVAMVNDQITDQLIEPPREAMFEVDGVVVGDHVAQLMILSPETKTLTSTGHAIPVNLPNPPDMSAIDAARLAARQLVVVPPGLLDGRRRRALFRPVAMSAVPAAAPTKTVGLADVRNVTNVPLGMIQDQLDAAFFTFIDDWSSEYLSAILAAGSVPVTDVPVPDPLLLPVNDIHDGMALATAALSDGVVELGSVDMNRLTGIADRLMHFARSHRSTAALAKYILHASGHAEAKSALVLSPKRTPDVSDTSSSSGSVARELVHGLRQVLGYRCLDIPEVKSAQDIDIAADPRVYRWNLSGRLFAREFDVVVIVVGEDTPDDLPEVLQHYACEELIVVKPAEVQQLPEALAGCEGWLFDL